MGKENTVFRAAEAEMTKGEMPHNSGTVRELESLAAWEELKARDQAVLVDVRTVAEWQFVGLPDVSSLGKNVICVSWKLYPGFATNPQFAEQLTAQGITKAMPLYFLCRSGGRSHDAAVAMLAQGQSECVNILDGFEGEPDEHRHRGSTGGWKSSGLPWGQG